MVPGLQVHDHSMGQTCSSRQGQTGMFNGERGHGGVKMGSVMFLSINFGGFNKNGILEVLLIRCQRNMSSLTFFPMYI